MVGHLFQNSSLEIYLRMPQKIHSRLAPIHSRLTFIIHSKFSQIHSRPAQNSFNIDSILNSDYQEFSMC